MTVRYREMKLADHGEAMQLWHSCPGMGLSGADQREQVAIFLRRNPGLSLVAEEDGRLIGTVLCGHDGRRGYLYHMAVHSDYRRAGVGRTLLEWALAGLKKEGIQKCHVFVYGENREGLLFWEKTEWVMRGELVILSIDI